MRAIVLAAAAPFLTGCTATLLYEPQVLVSPYLTVYRLSGDVAMQSDPGGGAPIQDNSPQNLRLFGQERHEDDIGVRAEIGDGFGGLRLDYFRLDMNTTRSKALEDDWGQLLEGDEVRMPVEMDEFRLGYLEPFWDGKVNVRERQISYKFAGGAVIAHRGMHQRAKTTDGLRQQTVSIDGDVGYAAFRARAAWQNLALDLDYALSPDLQIGGDWNGTQQDVEVRASYALPMRDVTFFAGYRYSTLEAQGREQNTDYAADLRLDGYQFGLMVNF